MWAQAELQLRGVGCCRVCLESSVKWVPAGGGPQPWQVFPRPLCGCTPASAEVITVYQELPGATQPT